MEFLSTPDLPSKWPPSSAHPSTLLPTTPAKPSETPRPPLDRATIKSSFQSLFNPSPNVATPALMRAPGLTPFINGMPTPGLPTPGLMPPSTFLPHTKPDQSMTTPSALSTPLLQAAAKEAVRREFTNMPSYVATPQSFERVVPTTSPGDNKQSMQVVVQTGAAAAAAGATTTNTPSDNPQQPAPQTVPQQPISVSQAPAQVPTGSSAKSTSGPHPSAGVPSASQPVPTGAGNPGDMSLRNPNPFFFPAQPPGMVLMGQHGMMIPPAPMYPPGMMVFPTSHASFPTAPGVMFPNQNVGNTRANAPKSETPAERKARIELEKQELIREFKKKTREAALVRFRQKRRERRFGKLIRYDCRKKLADARPRVKGRFVRIKADEDDVSEGAQVVPNMH